MCRDARGIVYIDGVWTDPAEAMLSVRDAGVQPGLTVFDTMPVVSGRVFRMEAHLDRFFASMKVVRFDSFPHTREGLETLVIEATRRSGLLDALVTIMATRGSRDPDAWVPVHKLVPTVVIDCRPGPDLTSVRRAGYRACVSTVRSIPTSCLPPQVKHYNRLPHYLAEQEAHDAGVDMSLMLDLDGYVTEGPTFNVFAVRDERLFTPAHGMLRGVTRDTVIKVAAHLRIPVVEGPLTPYDLYTAEEVFATSVSRGAIGIVEIDHRRVGDGSPGPTTRRIDDMLRLWRTDDRYSRLVHEQHSTVHAQ
jgi:branched-chain amino acid aminotransferase